MSISYETRLDVMSVGEPAGDSALVRRVRHVSAPRGSLRAATDPLHVSLILLMILTISRVHQQFPILSAVRPALALVAFACVQAVMNPKLLSEKGLLFTWPPKVVAGFVTMACLSIPFGISPGASGLFVLEMYSTVVVFAALLVLAIRRAADLYAFVWAFVLGGGILGYFANYVFHLEPAGAGFARLNNLYMYDANDAGLIFVVVVPLTILTLQVSRWQGKILSIAFLYLEWSGIARTGSRGSFMGILAIGLGLLLLPTGLAIWKRLGMLVGAVLLLLVAAPPGYWAQMMTITHPTSDYNWTSRGGRKEIAKRGLGYMLDHPLTGVGISNFPRAEGTISDMALNAAPNGPGIKWSAPHNSHIEAAAELGIPGLLLWSAMLIGGLLAPLRLRKRLPRQWRHGAPDERFIYNATIYVSLAMLGFIVSCTFVSFSYLDPVYILLAFVSGLYVCSESMMVRRNQRPALRVGDLGIPALKHS